MSTHSEIYDFLSSQPGITALVSDRIYPVIVPELADFPCIRFLIRDSGGFKDADGQGTAIGTELQTDCLADTLDEALQIAAAIKAVLKNFSGVMGNLYVFECYLESEFDDYEAKLAEGKFRASQAWNIWNYQ